MRKNRRDPQDETHDMVWADPEGFTRASRRAAGHRGRVHPAHDTILPRYARRHFMKVLDAPVNTRRRRKMVARMGRLLQPLGLYTEA